MGRPKTPLEQMAARSPDGKTPGKRNLPEPYKGAVERSVPPAPVELHGRAEVEWRNIWEAGWWLKRDQDYHWVEQLVLAYGDVAIFRARVQEDGLVTKGYAGQDTAHPLIAEIRKCEQTIRQCLQELGFSPVARAKLAIADVQHKTALQKMISESKK